MKLGSMTALSRDLLRAGGFVMLLLGILTLTTFPHTRSILCWTARPTVLQPQDLPIEVQEPPLPERCSDEERRLQHADWFDDYSGTSDGEGKRVALLFFGLPRAMPYTIPHIQKNVIQVIKDAGYRPTVFVHAYNSTGKDSSSEDEEKEEEQDWKALMPFKYTVTNQTEVLEKYKTELDACINWNWTDNKDLKEEPWDGWKGGVKRPNSENWLCQLESINRVARLWEKNIKTNPLEYAAVAFMRPDVLYYDPFPVSLIAHLKPRELWVPAWSGNGGINDRFALLHPKSAGVWKYRLEYTLQHCLKAPIHSESFTRDYARHKTLAIKGIAEPRFVFFRVRSTGAIEKNEWVNNVPDVDEAKKVVTERHQALKKMECW